MAEKKYREAKTDAEKKRGKSTDELTFEEALRFFKARGEEKGSSRFRWRGEAYDLKGNKLGSKPKAKSSSAPKESERPKERPESSSAPKTSKRPPEGRKPKTLLRSDNTDSAGDKPIELSINGPITPRAGSVGPVSYAEWSAMTRVERANLGLPKNNLELQNDNRGRVDMSSKGKSEGAGASGSYAKGGLARKTSSSGSMDYRKTGRFSKSASPRGYK